MEIPGFRIKRTIGRGGMATAHLATQESLGRDVVLKVMNTSGSDDSDFTERFMNEARIVASLNHPHIITIHDIGTAGDLVYIAMEYVQGGDLKARIEAGIEPTEAFDIVVKIARALGYAHSHGIVHRDVKPANILFRADGTALLSDFGIAKQVSVDSELTSTGTILGSPFYMSPEQSEGMVVDGRTDLYSLGVILFEMLTGERPYQGDSAIKVIMQHIQSPLPRLPAALEDYQALVDRMMAKNRDQRFSSADALVSAVEQFVHEREAEQEAPAADPESTGGLVPLDEVRRLRIRLAALAAGLVIVVVAFAGFYVYAQSLRPTLVVRTPAAGASSSTVDASTTRARPGATPAAAASGSQVGVGDVVRALEWLAKNSLRDDRLTQPPADNALYYYSRLLDLDPGNRAALDGFGAIADRFVVLAEEAFANREYAQAQSYIALGLQVEPDNDGLRSLQGFIEEREKTVFETFLDFFRSKT